MSTPYVTRFTRLSFAVWLLIALPLAHAQNYVFVPLAGEPGRGSNDGTAATARYLFPSAVAADAAGNVYVADFDNHTIRKLTPGGVVSTLAGIAGFSGEADGIGTAARFNGPLGIAVDLNGTVYVADSLNHTIRRISAEGVVTTLAGTALQSGATDAAGALARFNIPVGIAFDRSSGTLLVSDALNSTVRRVTAAGVVTTVAGAAGQQGSANGTGAAARFNFPFGIAVDGSGNIFVADMFNNLVRRITPAGVVSALAGTFDNDAVVDGTGSAAAMGYPEGIAVDANGVIFVTDAQNHVVRRITAAGVVTTIAGSVGQSGAANGVGAVARFNQPSGLAVESSGTIVVADSGNHVIRRINAAGTASTVSGVLATQGSSDGPRSTARFSSPGGVTLTEAGDLVVTDTRNHTLRVITPTGVVSTLAGSPGIAGHVGGTGSVVRFSSPTGVAAGPGRILYVADSGNHVIRRVEATGAVATYSGLAGEPGYRDGFAGTALFRRPTGVAVDRAGNVYVADTGNQVIRRITTNGVVSTLAGSAGQGGSVDGRGALARFSYPEAIAIDAQGTLYVADGFDSVIRRVTSDGVVTTIAGSAGNRDHVDGPALQARFDSPRGLAVDAQGNIFVADSITSAVRRISVAGEVTSPSSTFLTPVGVAVAPDGVVYVLDEGANTVYRGQPVSAGSPSGLTNLSVRTAAGAGADTLIVGFSTSGSGVRPLLIRGVGPTLAMFGVASVHPDPSLRLEASGRGLLAQNNDWDPTDGVGTVAAFAGAFPLPVGSRDAALVYTATNGPYTAQISGGSGVTLLEAYDIGDFAGPQLVNLSARSRVGAGAESLIAGFVVSGVNPVRLLIRGVGPALASFGVTGTLADPTVEVFRAGGTRVTENDDWSAGGQGAALDAAFREANAFPLPPGSKDAALIVVLPPGVYTAQVSGVGGTLGVALVEIYLLPPSG